jgi:hypothetical protein
MHLCLKVAFGAHSAEVKMFLDLEMLLQVAPVRQSYNFVGHLNIY